MLPAFMSPSPSLQVQKSDVSLLQAPPGGRQHISYTIPGLTLRHQERQNWCWAAVGACLDSGRGPTNGRSQCDIANDYGNYTSFSAVSTVLNSGDCCDSASETDVYGYLNEVMDMLHISNGRYWTVNRFDTAHQWVKDELRNGRPVPVRVQWPSSIYDGHFIIIIGLKMMAGQEAYEVFDPARMYRGDGNRRMESLNAFEKRYAGSGQWTHSYPSK